MYLWPRVSSPYPSPTVFVVRSSLPLSYLPVNSYLVMKKRQLKKHTCVASGAPTRLLASLHPVPIFVLRSSLPSSQSTRKQCWDRGGGWLSRAVVLGIGVSCWCCCCGRRCSSPVNRCSVTKIIITKKLTWGSSRAPPGLLSLRPCPVVCLSSLSW